MSISIVLADDHPVVRQGLRHFLQAETDFAIVGEAEDGLETVRVVERLHPNVLILDLMMPGLAGLDVLPIVRQRSPRTAVVVFSMYGSEDFVLQALKNGAIGYVLKGCDPAQMAEAVRKAVAGQHYLSPSLSERAFAAYHEKAASVTDPHDLLTPRERQVLQLAAEGIPRRKLPRGFPSARARLRCTAATRCGNWGSQARQTSFATPFAAA